MMMFVNPLAQGASRGRPQLLTPEQKCHVARSELDELRKDLKKFRASSDRDMIKHKVLGSIVHDS